MDKTLSSVIEQYSKDKISIPQDKAKDIIKSFEIITGYQPLNVETFFKSLTDEQKNLLNYNAFYFFLPVMLVFLIIIWIMVGFGYMNWMVGIYATLIIFMILYISSIFYRTRAQNYLSSQNINVINIVEATQRNFLESIPYWQRALSAISCLTDVNNNIEIIQPEIPPLPIKYEPIRSPNNQKEIEYQEISSITNLEDDPNLSLMDDNQEISAQEIDDQEIDDQEISARENRDIGNNDHKSIIDGPKNKISQSKSEKSQPRDKIVRSKRISQLKGKTVQSTSEISQPKRTPQLKDRTLQSTSEISQSKNKVPTGSDNKYQNSNKDCSWFQLRSDNENSNI